MKYALDTNIYIDAFRDPAVEAALLRFLERALPFTFLSVVVMQELAAGARTSAQGRELQRSVFQPFARRRRVFAPMTTAFVRSGRLIAAVAAREGWPAVHENPSLLNDALLAASCRDAGITLVTQDSDFDRFAQFMKGWRHVRPWPNVT
ncbi:MAG: type II toxin-antitoxin system VapC family toxin [Acidobacteriota bacterium]